MATDTISSRQAWGYALEDDGSAADKALIERAKAIGWHVVKDSEGGSVVYLLRPSVTDQAPSPLWKSYASERHAWSKLPRDFEQWGTE